MRRLLGMMIACAALSAPAAFAQGDDPWAAMDWSLAKGANTIKGSALLRTRGGEVRTCAGFPVRLIPSATATDSYIAKAFGSDEGGLSHQPWRAQFGEYTRTTTCDAQGNFSFEGLPDGRYFAIAKVEWEVAGEQQGGLIAQLVRVRDGTVKTVVLTQ
jgi:hypothetical protein